MAGPIGQTLYGSIRSPSPRVKAMSCCDWVKPAPTMSSWTSTRHLHCRQRLVPRLRALHVPDVPFPINVQSRHAPMTPAMENLALAKVGQALQHYQGVIREVMVTLEVSGRGNNAHHRRVQTVTITVYTLGYGAIHIDETEGDLHGAVTVAAGKIRRTMEKLKGRAMHSGLWHQQRGNEPGHGASEQAAAQSPDDSQMPAS